VATSLVLSNPLASYESRGKPSLDAFLRSTSRPVLTKEPERANKSEVLRVTAVVLQTCFAHEFDRRWSCLPNQVTRHFVTQERSSLEEWHTAKLAQKLPDSCAEFQSGHILSFAEKCSSLSLAKEGCL